MKKPAEPRHPARVVPGPVPPGAARDLAAARPGPLATVYIPLERSFPESKQNAVLQRQAAAALEKRLGEAGLSSSDAAAWSARLAAVETDVRALEAPVSGLAAFLDAKELRAYTLVFPVAFHVNLGDHFSLRPLLQEAARDHLYRLLALSVNRVAMFEGSARGLKPSPMPNLPASMAAALDLAPQPVTLRSRTETLSHDRAGGTAERAEDLIHFHRAVARALEGIPNPELPLVLAADATQQGEFRAIARTPGLIPEGVMCNPDYMLPGDLHARAWPLVEGAAAREEREAAAGYERARNTGKGLDLLDDVVEAALRGRVRRLWLDAEKRVPGRIDDGSARVVPSDGPDADVLEALASIVLGKGGDVIVAEPSRMPAGTGVAAELR